MFSMQYCNYAVTALGLCIGGAMVAAAFQFPMALTEQGPGPGFWPALLGCAMILAALVLLFYTQLKKGFAAREQVALGTEASRRVYMIMGLIALFCILIFVLGFYPATVLLIPSIMYRLECRDKKQIFLTTLGVTVFIYVVFGQLLHTAMPSSMFLE